MIRMLFFTIFACINVSFAQSGDPRALEIIEKVVQANGGKDKFYELNDVAYAYLYKAPDGKVDYSEEKYIFDNEVSWAMYPVHEKYVLPDKTGKVVQFFDGKDTRTFHKGEPVFDSEINKGSDFLRKTNYYWFTMMFKLLDQGTEYHYLGEYSDVTQDYHRIALTYQDNVGDVQDEYLLFINKRTNLIDFFLFTVMDFNIKDPFLMRVKYKEVDGVLVPAFRKYTKVKGWEDYRSVDNKWAYEISLNVKFDNGLTVDQLLANKG